MLNRVRHSGGKFTSVPNEVIRQDMSCEAFWFLCLVMSLPDAWNFTIDGIIETSKKSEYCINKAIKELKSCELCKVVSRRNERGNIKGWDYFFRWSKNEQWSEFEPQCENPQCGKSTMWENHNVVNRTQINKDIIKKEEIKKEEESLTLSLPFSSDKFKDAWSTLLKQKNWKKKSKSSLETSLKKLSRFPEAFAIELIENAIAGEWKAVVFNDTDKAFEDWKKSHSQSSTRITSLEQLRNGK